MDIAAAVHGLERVLHHVEERLLNLVTVSEDERELTRDVERDAHAELLHLFAEETGGFGDDGDEVSIGEIGRGLADGAKEVADNAVETVDFESPSLAASRCRS